MNHIAFPGLGLEFAINPVAFTIGSKPIYWYAIIIAAGFLLAAAYAMRRAKSLSVDPDRLLDALIWAVPISIVCARLYYVAFEFERYRDNPISILYIWEGGIAIYGAVIGAILTFALYCKVKKQNLPAMLDVGALGLLIGQAIGRWGNFVNGEAFGTATDLPWRMVVNGVVAHPTFLYESLWNALGFVLLHFRSKHRKFKGEIFLLYVAWYGLGRGIIEGLRTDSLYIAGTGLRVSQLVGFATCLLAAIILFVQYIFRDHESEDMTDASHELIEEAEERAEGAETARNADSIENTEETITEEKADDSEDH